MLSDDEILAAAFEIITDGPVHVHNLVYELCRRLNAWGEISGDTLTGMAWPENISFENNIFSVKETPIVE